MFDWNKFLRNTLSKSKVRVPIPKRIDKKPVFAQVFRGYGETENGQHPALVESGPAAGALAARWFAKGLDEGRLLAFDMGGTTAKATLIDGFEPELTNTFEVARIYRFKKGSGFPVSVPSGTWPPPSQADP